MGVNLWQVDMGCQRKDHKMRDHKALRHYANHPCVMRGLVQVFMMLFTLAMEGNKQAYCRGYVILSDQADITLRHAMMMTPGVLKQHMVVFQVARYIYSCSSIISILYLQDSYPMDNQALIANSRLFLVNMPGLLERFLNMFRSRIQ